MSEYKDFQEFCKDVADRIPNYLLQFHVNQVRIETVTKNNGVTLTGLIVAIQESKVVPNVYLEYYYEKYQFGSSIEELLDEIAEEYRNMYDQIQRDGIDCDFLDDTENQIFLKLVNYEKNKEQLKDTPYIPFFNMAITFRYLVRKDEVGIASALISNKELQRLSMTVEEMYELAKVNTKRLFPYEIRPLDEIIKKHICPDFDEDMNSGIYVLSNDQYMNGATYLVYKEVLLEFSEKCGGDFYIIPSSVHELLLCPKQLGMEKDFLQNILQEANESVVEKMDYLSDSVYEFCVEDALIHI